MGINRSELKKNARTLLAKNYWWIVLVSIILAVTAGGFRVNLPNVVSTHNGSVRFFSPNSQFSPADNQTFDDFDYKQFFDNPNVYMRSYLKANDFNIDAIIRFVIDYLAIILAIILIGVVTALLLKALVSNPFQIGCKRWFLKNRTTKPEMGEVVHTFSNGYGNSVKVMFIRDVCVFLWSLLFVIPGIIKSIEYSMIPYLLAENPTMSKEEAFARSKQLTDGYKMEIFILELSFIGWMILSGLTGNLLGVFYVYPYVNLTMTELYVYLCNQQGQASY